MKNGNIYQSQISHLIIAGFVTCLLVGEIKANEPVETIASKKKQQTQQQVEQKVTDEQIAQWIKSLDSNNSETRQQSAEKLQQSGTAAIDALAKAAETKNPELSTQCLEILKNMYESEDKNVKKAATTALEKLKKSKFKQVAQRAKEITQKVNLAPNGRFGRGGINVRFNMARAAGMNMKQSNNNGQRHTEVEKKNRKIVIDDFNNTNIVMKITETKKGKAKTTIIKAKNLKELKKKHPKAAKEYEKYCKKNFNMQLKMFGGAGNIPFKFPRKGKLNPKQKKARQKAIEEIKKALKKRMEEHAKQQQKQK